MSFYPARPVVLRHVILPTRGHSAVSGDNYWLSQLGSGVLLASRGRIQGCCWIFYNAQDSLHWDRAEREKLLQTDFKTRSMWGSQRWKDLCACPFHRGTRRIHKPPESALHVLACVLLCKFSVRGELNPRMFSCMYDSEPGSSSQVL